MAQWTRRSFLKTGAIGAGAFVASPLSSRLRAATAGNDILFQPYLSEESPALSWAYAADQEEDPFKSDIAVTHDGIVVPANMGARKFSINARWYIRDFGYVWLSADNNGRFYSSDDAGSRFILNLEFARSRIVRNGLVRTRYQNEGAVFSPEVVHLDSLSQELLQDAITHKDDPERSARLADRALTYAMKAGERIELERARAEIQHRRDRPYFGCESRQYVWAKSEEFTKRFTELFDFSTITHYVWDSWYPLFEPEEGRYNWGIKDDIVRWLSENHVTLQGRPLFWFHPTVTPDWLKSKSFDQVKSYVDTHTRDLVRHYGDRVLQWEVVNEFHDWANIHNFRPDQITNIVRQACDKTKEVNPKVIRILNNCCPWAEYAARGRMARMDATRTLRSPRKYLQDLSEAGVDYDVLGIQIYFPQRDLSDIVRLLERLEKFGKPIYITEIGASSNLIAPSPSGAVTATSDEPYAWHRQWDEELQADWLEQVYTVYCGRPSIKAINWYDFSDFRPFIVNGGLVREDSSPKKSFHRLRHLLSEWDALPSSR